MKYTTSKMYSCHLLLWAYHEQEHRFTFVCFHSYASTEDRLLIALCCFEIPGIIPGLQILLMSGVTVTSASQILESFWKIWSQVSQRKKPFADFTALGPGMNNYRDGYTV